MTLTATPDAAARTTPAAVRPTAQVVGPSRRRGGRSLVRVAVAALSLMAMLGALATGNPLLLLCAVTAATAVPLLRWFAWDVAVPASALLLVALASAAGLAAHLLGGNPLAHQRWLAGGYLVWGLIVLLHAARTTRPVVPLPAQRQVRFVHLAGAAAVVVGLLQTGPDRVPLSWAMQGTDLLQHMILLRDVQLAGVLDYGANGYPRGFHALAAFVSVTGRPETPPGLIMYDLRLLAGASWAALGVAICAGVALTVRLARAAGLGDAATVLATAAVAFGMLLGNGFLDTFVYMGAVPSLLAIVALWALPLWALEKAGSRASCAAAASCAAVVTMLLAHLWQALVLVPCVALAFFLLRRPGTVSRAAVRDGLRELCVAAPVVAAAAALALPPMLGVASSGGTSLAAIPGQLSPPPSIVLLIGLLCVLVSCRQWRQAHVRLLAGSVVGLVLVAAVLLRGAGNGLDLDQYYPVKVGWFLLLLLAPAAAVGSAAVAWFAARGAWAALGRLGASARLARFTVCAVVCAVGVMFGLARVAAAPSSVVGVATGLWTAGPPPAAALLEISKAHAGRYAPAVTVPVAVGTSAVLDRHDSYIVSKLMSMQTGQVQNHGNPFMVCDDVAAVAGRGAAVVVTKLEPALLQRIMRREGCGDVRIVQVPGGIRDADFLSANLDGLPGQRDAGPPPSNGHR